jgi:hypothetical protein
VAPAHLLAVAGLALLAPLACADATTTLPEPDGGIPVRGGTTVSAEGTDLLIAFEGVPEDSRCPVDVQCVWAGDATVALRLEGGGAGAETVGLHTNADPKQATHGRHVVTLVGLRPLPASGRTLALGDYVAVVRVDPLR